MAIDTFIRGNEDITRTVTLTSDGSTALDTDDFTGINVQVRHKKFGTVVGTYTLNDSTVSKETPTSGGQITFIVSRIETASQPTGVYQFEVETEEADASYDGSVRHRSFVGDCFVLKANIFSGSVT